MTDEVRAIYDRMPPDAQQRVDRVTIPELRDLCIRLWSRANRPRRPTPTAQTVLPMTPSPAVPPAATDPDDDWRNRF